jgi:hypothetical protein
MEDDPGLATGVVPSMAPGAGLYRRTLPAPLSPQLPAPTEPGSLGRGARFDQSATGRAAVAALVTA